jgi:hypothetical protein
MPIINNLPNSLRWQAMQTLLAALQAAPTLAGVRVVLNPRTPASLSGGAYTVFLKDWADTLLKKSGQTEERSHQFVLGVVARSDLADSEADALHEAAADVLRTTFKVLVQQCGVVNLTEVSTKFEAESLEIDGALCLSTWDLPYRKPGPQ